MSWLSDASANRIIQSYAKNFVDVSGNFTVRNAVSVTTDLPVSWSQLGSDIDGENMDDQSGYSVSLSSDGTIVAIGARYNDGTASNAGHVRVYQYANSTWSQLGSDIDGEAGNDQSGWSVSLSSDGTIVAIGARFNDGTAGNAGHVRVYQYANSTWNQLGNDIDGEVGNDQSGWSVSLSSDGTIVAIGAINNSGSVYGAGHVRVYQYANSTWSQLGSDIDGEAAYDNSGYSVSLSSDGTIVAIGAWKNAGGGSEVGHVRVYQYASSTWTQLGSDIDGEASTDYFGYSVSLSNDGTILAVGALLNDGAGSNAGHVRVYQYANSTWSQLGSDIDGAVAGEEFGNSVSLSSDGTILAVGARSSSSSTGHTQLYKYANSTWSQLGSNIDGEATSDKSGYSVSLSSDGTIVAIGAYLNDGTAINAGHVRIYEMEGGLNTNIESKEMMDVTGGTVSMLSNTMDISSAVVDISGTTWINRGQSGATIADAYQGSLVIESSSSSSSDAVLYVDTAGQAAAFSIRANGDLYSANTLRHSSDDRRKINEQYITNATETIKKLSPQTYTKLNDLVQNGGTPTKTESGLIAQEIYYNAPELRHLVHTDGEPLPYDLSGNDIQNDPDYSALGWGNKSATVDYIGLIPYLIKSNQEQQEIIENKTQVLIDNKKTLEEDLQTRISALEA